MGDTGEVESFTKEWFEVCPHKWSFWEVEQVTFEPVISFPPNRVTEVCEGILNRPVKLRYTLFDLVDVSGSFDGVLFRVTIEQWNVSDVIIDGLLDTVGVVSHGG